MMIQHANNFAITVYRRTKCNEVYIYIYCFVFLNFNYLLMCLNNAQCQQKKLVLQPICLMFVRWRVILILFNYYQLVECCISEKPTKHYVSFSYYLREIINDIYCINLFRLPMYHALYLFINLSFALNLQLKLLLSLFITHLTDLCVGTSD